MLKVIRTGLESQWPLIGFVVPTLAIGFGLVIPESCFAGVNEYTLGFASTIAGACATYWLGQRQVLKVRDSHA